MKGELGLVVNVDFERVLHELLANRSYFLGQSGAKHHDLFLSRCGTENILNISAHVYVGMLALVANI